MYKTINKVFHNHGGKKKTRGEASDSINRSHSSEKSQNAVPYAGTPIPQHVAVAAAQDLRPDSPLRLGSPSIAAIGEATLKKIVKRAFYGEGSGAPAGRLKEVPTEMLAFEIGSIMRRMLEIYDSMAEKMLSSLRSNLQVTHCCSPLPIFRLLFLAVLSSHIAPQVPLTVPPRSLLVAPGVVTLISNDLRVLWGLAGYEKHEELRVVAARVAVLGRKGADVRLRRLERVLAHLDSPDANYKDFAVSSAEGEVLLRFMREQAEATNTLKAEMEAIQLLHSRIQEYGEWNSLQEMVTQGKLVEKLQGHCLWAYNLDYLVQVSPPPRAALPLVHVRPPPRARIFPPPSSRAPALSPASERAHPFPPSPPARARAQLLVVAACYVRKKIFASFGHGMCPARIRDASLGSAGLALHYANVVVLLERIIQQPDAVLGPTRDELYDMLPRSIQYLLRVQLQDPLNFTADGRVEANLKRGLLLLPTMAHNTIHWHSLHTPGAALDFGEMVFQVQVSAAHWPLLAPFCMRALVYACTHSLSPSAHLNSTPCLPPPPPLPPAVVWQTFYYANVAAVNATLVDVLLGLCRICGVEAPIGSISLHAPATADYSLALARSQEEDERGFRRQWGMEAREEDWFGGQVFKVADERRAPRRDAAQGGAQQGAHAGGFAEGGGYGGGGYGGGSDGQFSGDGYGEQGGQWQVQGGGMDGRGDGRAAAAAGSMGGGAFARVRVGQEEGRGASMDRRSGSWVSDASTDDNTTFGASSPSLSLSEAGSASSAKPTRGRSSRLSRDPSLSTDGPSTPSSLASDRDGYAAEAPGAGDGGAGGRGGQGAAAPPAGRKASRTSSRKGSSGSNNSSDRPSTPPMFSSPLRSPSADLPPTTPQHHSRTPQRSPRQGTGGDGDVGGGGGGEGGPGWGGHSEGRKSRSKKGARGSSSSSGGGAEGGFFSSSGSFKDHGSSPMRPSNLSVPASVSSSPSPSSVPRQVSADALSVGSNDSDGRWSSSLSRRSSRWAGVVGFGKSKSSRLPEGAPPMPPPPTVVGGVQESVAGSSVEEGGALAGENPYDDPAFAGLDTPTLRKAMQSGGLVGCFTGGSSVADSDSEAESLSSVGSHSSRPASTSSRSRRSSRAPEGPSDGGQGQAGRGRVRRSTSRSKGGSAVGAGTGEGRGAGGSAAVMQPRTRHYYSQPLPPRDQWKEAARDEAQEYFRDLKACVNAAAKSYSLKRMAEARLEEERKLRQRAEVNVSELEAEVARLKEDKEQLRTQLLLLQSHAHAVTQAEQQRRALVDHFFTLFNSMAHTE
ncbi:unnamed protein product, partial [Closterium sp. Naga37s-1]